MSDITNIPTTGADIASALLFTAVVVGAHQTAIEADELGRLIEDGVIEPDPVTVSELVARLDDASAAMEIIWMRVNAGDVPGTAVA